MGNDEWAMAKGDGDGRKAKARAKDKRKVAPRKAAAATTITTRRRGCNGRTKARAMAAGRQQRQATGDDDDDDGEPRRRGRGGRWAAKSVLCLCVASWCGRPVAMGLLWDAKNFKIFEVALCSVRFVLRAVICGAWLPNNVTVWRMGFEFQISTF